MSLHPELAAFAERELGDILAAPPLTTQDALEFALVNGVRVIVRYAAPDAYSLRWRTSAAARCTPGRTGTTTFRPATPARPKSWKWPSRWAWMPCSATSRRPPFACGMASPSASEPAPRAGAQPVLNTLGTPAPLAWLKPGNTCPIWPAGRPMRSINASERIWR